MVELLSMNLYYQIIIEIVNKIFILNCIMPTKGDYNNIFYIQFIIN